jgi:hypothetical protein
MPEAPKQKQQQTSRTGTKRLILQKRDFWLFNALSTLRILDKRQAASIAGFNSNTRVNERLLKLRQTGLLKRFFFVSAVGGKRAIYCLTKKSADLIGIPLNAVHRPSDSFLIGDRFVAHQLAINEVYCASAIRQHASDPQISAFRLISKPLSDAIPIIPDAYFEINSNSFIRPMFLEVDLGTERHSIWNEKIKQYLNLASSGEFERLFAKPRFAVLVVTTSNGRMHSLRSHIRKSTSKLFYFTTFQALEEQGFWQSIWLRPEGEQTQPLI